MGIAYRCKKELRITIVVWDGTVTFSQWLENTNKLSSDPDFALTSMQVVDLRFASIDPAVGEKEFKEIIDILGKKKEMFFGRKVAVIADEEFGRATVFKHMGESLGASLIVFNDLLIACHWLGINILEVEKDIEGLRTQLRKA